MSLNTVAFTFKNFACSGTHYATLNKASAITLSLPDVQVVILQGFTNL